MNLTVIYEDIHVIVCCKPAGVATQTRRTGEPDMVSLIKNHIYRQAKDKQEPYLAVIHRLDQPVEGLLVFAKTPFAAKELNRQLQQKDFGKHYLALLCGKPENIQGTLTDYLIKDGQTNMSRVCCADEPGAKKARLDYRLISNTAAEHPGTCLAEITLTTGRHHQIRVQMAHMGCPLLGDTKYNPDPYLAGHKTALALCAYKLTFLHPKTKKQMLYQITPAFNAAGRK